MNFNISIHEKQLHRKPETASEKQSLATGYIWTKTTLDSLADTINNNQTICSAQLKSQYRLNANFISTETIILDFDSSKDSIITPDKAISNLKEYGLISNLIYFTAKHTEAAPRFRILMVIDAPIYAGKLFGKFLKEIASKCGADTSATAESNMFYGGNNAKILSNEVNSHSKVTILAPILVNNRGGKAVARMTERSNSKALQENYPNAHQPYIYIGGADMANFRKHNRFDFAYASSTSNIFNGFAVGTLHLSYAKIFNLYSNMRYVNGGRKWMENLMKKAGTYSNSDFDIFTQIDRRNYQPEDIETFDADLKGKFKNILSLRAKRPNQVEKLFNAQKATLEEGRNKLQKAFQAAVTSSNPISIIFAGTGLGKGYNMLKLGHNWILAFPTHKLKNEMMQRAIADGIECISTPDSKNMFHTEALNDKINTLLEVNESEAVSSIRQNVRDSEDVEDIEYTEEDTLIAQNYYSELQDAHESECMVFTTHARAILTASKFKNKDSIVFDEDIKDILLPTSSVLDGVLFNRLDNLINSEIPYRIEKELTSIRNVLKTSGSEINIELNITDEIKQDLIEFLLGKRSVSYIIGLIKADKILKLTNEETSVSSFNYGNKKELPLNEEGDLLFKKVIITSADIKQSTYRTLLKDDFDFIHCGYVQNRTDIIQYNIRSNSSSSLSKDNFKAPQLFTANVITYQKHRSKLGSKLDMYFGNCAGDDSLNGQDSIVYGTYRKPVGAVLLEAQLLEIDYSDSSKDVITVENDFFRFPFFTFNDENLRAIDLNFIEKSLLQAAGRSRTLSKECKVEIHSSYPLIEADVQKGKTFIEATEFYDERKLSTKVTNQNAYYEYMERLELEKY